MGGDAVYTESALAHKSDAVVVDTTTNSKGATTTTYMVPTKQLPTRLTTRSDRSSTPGTPG